VSAAFLVVSGHDEQTFADAIEGLVPDRVTLVVLMGLGRATAVASSLLTRRWSRGTPVAIVTDASMPDQNVWQGTLDDLAAGRHLTDGVVASSPGTIVVGEVVRVNMRAVLDEAQACGS
jgi:siroheme synthase